jgi:hypothetical protein
MPRISTDNYDTVASWNGSQDLFVVEQPDGTKVATPAMVKQFIEAGDFEATGEVKDGHGNILADMAKSADVDTEIVKINSRLTPMNSFRIGGINGASGTLVDQCLAFARNIKNTYGVINAFEGMFFYSGTSKPTDIPENVTAWNYASGKFLIRTVDSNNNVDATIILFGYGASKIAIKTIANSVQASNWVVLGS